MSKFNRYIPLLSLLIATNCTTELKRKAEDKEAAQPPKIKQNSPQVGEDTLKHGADSSSQVYDLPAIDKDGNPRPDKPQNTAKKEEKKGEEKKITTPVPNKRMEEVVKDARAKYATVGNFHAGLALVKSHEGKFGYINQNGDEVLKTEYDFAEDLSGEPAMARVRIRDKVGCIDRQGQFAVPMKFRFIDKFFRGLAQVRMIDGEVYYIDKHGNHVCDALSEYHEGVARIKKGELIGYIDSYGKIIIAPKYNYGTHFTNGKAEVKEGNKYRVIDIQGVCVKDCD